MKSYIKTGTARTVGMYGYSTGTIDYTFKNAGTITIKTSADKIYGMYAASKDNSKINLTNSGSIELSGNLDVYGMFANADAQYINTSVTNNSTIKVSGGIFVSGMHAILKSNSNSNLINNGYIEVSATGNYIHGMYAISVGNTGISLTNSGSIEVSGNNLVYGMYLTGTSSNIHLNNTGIITAKATGGVAFEAYGAINYNVNTWATTLRTWNVNDAVFGGGTNDNLTFQNSTLILRPGTEAQGFEFGKEYYVGKQADGMAAGVKGNVTGTISQAITEVPFLTATLTNGNNASTATVRLDANINDETVPSSASTMQGQMDNISSQLSQVRANLYAANTVNLTASNDDTVYINTTPKWTLFFNPYYSYTDNSKYNFDAKGMGITGGASYAMNEKLSFGAHLDFNASDYDGKSMNSYIKSFALGAHANYNIMPEWYVAGQVTGVFAENDNTYYGNTGTSLHGDSLYDSKTLYLALNTGYIWQISAMHSLTPEIGLSYLSTHNDDYTIGYNVAAYNMKYDSSSYSALYADAKLNWRSEWQLQSNNVVALLASAGLRQNLTGNEIENKFNAFGGNYKTMATEDNSTFLASLGVEYKKNDISAKLSYDGAYGSKQAKHTGNLLVKYAF